MKKIISLILISIFILSVFVGCKSKPEQPSQLELDFNNDEKWIGGSDDSPENETDNETNNDIAEETEPPETDDDQDVNYDPTSLKTLAINVNDYLHVSISGTNGEGKITAYIDYRKLVEDYKKYFGYEDNLENSLDIIKKTIYLAGTDLSNQEIIELSIDHLSNGDEKTISFIINNSWYQTVQDTFNVTLDCEEEKIVIKDLPEKELTEEEKEAIKKQEEEEARQREEEEKRQEEERKKAEEAAQKAEEERKAAEEAEIARKVEEERKKAEEERKKAEEEANKKAEEEARKKAEEEAAKKAAEDEAKNIKSDEALAQKLVDAVLTAKNNQRVLNEVLFATVTGNVSCYIETETEAALSEVQKSSRTVLKTAGIGNEHKEEYTYGDKARSANGKKFHFAGNMTGITITFKTDANGKIITGDAIVNTAIMSNDNVVSDRSASDHASYNNPSLFSGKLSSLSDTQTNMVGHYLYGKIIAAVGQEMQFASNQYKNSEFTVFVFVKDNKTVQIYGQWNGTNIK